MKLLLRFYDIIASRPGAHDFTTARFKDKVIPRRRPSTGVVTHSLEKRPSEKNAKCRAYVCVSRYVSPRELISDYLYRSDSDAVPSP